MDLIESIIPKRRRRRWRWYVTTAFKADVHVTYDGDLDLWSPVNNFTARQTYVAGYRDPIAFAWLKEFLRPGMTVFDVGANVGVYGLFIARRIGPTGTCHAFEPNPSLRPFLEENKRRNKLPNLDLNFIGTGDKASTMSFVTHKKNIGQSHISSASDNGIDSREVAIVRLDDFVAERKIEKIDFVKMDVEGFELPTLRGFESTLRDGRANIVHTEIDLRHMARYGYSFPEMKAFMNGLGYGPYRLTGGGFLPFEGASKSKDAYWSREPLTQA